MVTSTENSLSPALLPQVNGRYSFGAPLSSLTWFQAGGPAFVLYKPDSSDDLQHFLQEKSAEIPYFILGVGSNVLVRDGGYNGVVIKLGRSFSQISMEDGELVAGAAALDRTVAMFALQHQLSGIEFLVTIPGSIGGAVAMNAGCYGVEIKDVLSWVEIVDSKGNLRKLLPGDLHMTYRKAILPEGSIVVRAAFKVATGNASEIQQTIQKYLDFREESQPMKGRTGGSTFKNPTNAKAWELIDKAGCRGLIIGAAQMSEKHCNFMLNTGGATADELERLGELVRQRVKENSNLELEWEIIRVGKKVEVV